MQKVVTISRQFGSGGREIGRKLADELGFAFYDNELITLAAKESGFAEEIFRNIEERPTKSFLFSMTMVGGNVNIPSGMSLNDEVFMIQSDIIRQVAEKGACVIIGRCADYILNDNPEKISIFIHSNIKDRVNRAVSKYSIPNIKPEAEILRRDKKRAVYYNYYTDLKWGDAANYDLSLNSSVGVDKTVSVIKNYLETIWK